MSSSDDPLMARVPLEARSRVVELLAIIDEKDDEIERLRAEEARFFSTMAEWSTERASLRAGLAAVTESRDEWRSLYLDAFPDER